MDTRHWNTLVLTAGSLLLAGTACYPPPAEEPPTGQTVEDADTAAEAVAPNVRTGIDDHGLAEVTDRLYELTNEARGQRGVDKVEFHPALFQAARRHAVDMAEHDYLGHDSLDGETLRERLPEDFDYRSLAENVWGGTGIEGDSMQVAQRIFDGWMESSGHRGNIVKTEYTHMAVAVAQRARLHRAVQVFAALP